MQIKSVTLGLFSLLIASSYLAPTSFAASVGKPDHKTTACDYRVKSLVDTVVRSGADLGVSEQPVIQSHQSVSGGDLYFVNMRDASGKPNDSDSDTDYTVAISPDNGRCLVWKISKMDSMEPRPYVSGSDTK